MPDVFYGATMDALQAKQAVEKSDFIHFMFHICGNGDGNFHLSCYAVYGPDKTRTYEVIPLVDLTDNPWTNPDPSVSFSFPKLVMGHAHYLHLVQHTNNTVAPSITILPTGLKLNTTPPYNYLVFKMSTTVTVPVAADGGVVVGMNPPPVVVGAEPPPPVIVGAGAPTPTGVELNPSPPY